MKKLLWAQLFLPLIVLAAFAAVYILLDWLVHGSVRW